MYPSGAPERAGEWGAILFFALSAFSSVLGSCPCHACLVGLSIPGLSSPHVHTRPHARTYRWPSWHHPECLLHAAYARGGVRVRSLTDEHWPQVARPSRTHTLIYPVLITARGSPALALCTPQMRRACRIIREAGDQHRHRPTQLNSILNSTQLNTSTGR